jgi:preprotein translocase subunit SecA
MKTLIKNFLNEIKIEINKLSEESYEDLKIKINKIKKVKKDKPNSSLIVNWFALVQEISYREIGLRHYETQLLAGLFLDKGKIVEMKTGEGKTLVSTLPVSFNALEKKGVHVITVNEYLAERDQKWMGKIYNALGLSCGLVTSKKSLKEKKQSYKSDITYLTNSELVFDYLKDNCVYYTRDVVQRPFNFCLIDEIDSVLIDEARTPLILSGPGENKDLNKLYLAKNLTRDFDINFDFEIDQKRKDLFLTEKGYKKIKERLGIESLYDPEDPWILDILNALKAEYLFKLNKDYIILNKKIVIVDEFTGRIMEDRRWDSGVHEAIEMKENLNIQPGTRTKTSITYQNFFTLYPKLSGMTGTGKTAEEEFKDIYNLDVLIVPTINPLIRKDLPDLIYQTEFSKWKAVLAQSLKCFEKGQPILIGTSNIAKSEFLSDLFKSSNIPHNLLNAKPENVIKENEIIAQAGKKNAITIATNMAGRGTDILLGGNPSFETKEKLWKLIIEKEEISPEYNLKISSILKEYEKNNEKLELTIKNLPYSLNECKSNLANFYKEIFEKINKKCENEKKIVINLGGLFVLGTERNETRRIDNQLRGRAGRQGDPGTSQFFISLEDELLQNFGGNKIKAWMNYLSSEDDLPLESTFLSKTLDNAQKKIEMYNYEIRKNVFQYDNILNIQRNQFLKIRNDFLFNNNYEELFLRYNESLLDEKLEDSLFTNQLIDTQLSSYSHYYYKKRKKIKYKNIFYKELWISNDLRYTQSNLYQLGFLKKTKAYNILFINDFAWTDHNERMSYIRETINWKSYGQKNPLIEYNDEAFKSFKQMFEEIIPSMLYYFLGTSID